MTVIKRYLCFVLLGQVVVAATRSSCSVAAFLHPLNHQRLLRKDTGYRSSGLPFYSNNNPIGQQNQVTKWRSTRTTSTSTSRVRLGLSSATLVSTSTLRAAGVLIGSSLAGCVVERRSPNTGILTTMAVAAVCSNLSSLVPSHHALYDLCWTTFLPASLAFLLLASPSSEVKANSPKHTNESDEIQSSPRDVVRAVSVPFFMASIGSIMGCSLSFLVCRMFPQLWLQPQEAAIAASCLCASFIGGTVNFFATANVIGGGMSSTLMSSMAAADLLVMAVYFAGLAVALRSKWLASLFGDGALTKDGKDSTILEVTRAVDDTAASTPEATRTTPHIVQKVQAITFVSALGFLIVKASVSFEKRMAPIVPGTACAAIAGIAPIVQRTLLNRRNSLTKEMQMSARLLSEFCLQLLFASIGISAKLGEALLRGPACLFFSLFALGVHIATAFAGSLLVKRWFRLPLLLEDVLVASNAAIGGPATAAAFAGRIQSPRQRGLTIAGTVWGVVGYATGTTIGVALYKSLQTMAMP